MVFNQPKWGIWGLKSPWGVPSPPRRLGEKADGLCAEGNHCHPVGNGELGELEALGIHIPHSGPMEFSNHIIYIYIMDELESPHDAWDGGKYLPNRLISGWRMNTMRPDYIAQCESWDLSDNNTKISPTCGYGPAIQYPMISLLVVPFGPSNFSISSPWEAGGCEWTVVWEDMGMPLYLATLLV